MASVVTVVSRFCYRSPTRPLFVAALIFLILITWKFLTAQPDANALMMHSKHGIIVSKKAPKLEQQSVRELHSPLQSPVKKHESRKHLENKLNNNDKTKESEHMGKVYDDEENAIDGVDSNDVSLEVNHRHHGNRKQKIFNSDKSKGTVEKIYDEEEKTIEKEYGIQERKAERKEDIQSSAISDKTPLATKKDNHPLTSPLLSTRGITYPAATSSKPNQDDKNNLEITQNINPEDFHVGKYNILLTLVNMAPSSDLAKGMKKCLKSICRYSSVQLTVHVIVDDEGKMVVKEFFREIRGKCEKSEVVYHDVSNLTTKLRPITRVLMDSISSNSGRKSYYSNPIFFISTALYKIFTPKLTKLIMLDVDIRFFSDIKLLFDMFSDFKESNIMGMAHEQSPVYRHILYSYRAAHRDTLIGDPPPKGVPGFNSGVVLFNLEQMRNSNTYNKVLNSKRIKELTSKFQFHGHLGDQDFFTLLSFEYPELFYILPCSWNKQLCLYWKKNGYEDIFDLYNNCSEPIHVYHGNCRTEIPVNDKEKTNQES